LRSPLRAPAQTCSGLCRDTLVSVFLAQITGLLKSFQDVATRSVFRVIGILLSLKLSLAFADDMTMRRATENSIEREAVAMTDTFNNLQQFDNEGTRDIRKQLIDYTQSVVVEDWSSMAKDEVG